MTYCGCDIKTIGQTKNVKSNFAGLPLGFSPFTFQKMAVPTSLLINVHGLINWVDQTDDYRLRSSPERVMQAVKEAFR
jgi:hypothetical protein